MKHYDLADLKARLPDYLAAIGTEVFRKGQDQLAAACPIHRGTKRNFHADLMPDGTWVWNCRSGCGGEGGTVLDLHAMLHGHPAKSSTSITGAAAVLNVSPIAHGNTPTKTPYQRQHEMRRHQDIANERQRKLNAALIEKRTDLLTPYLSDDWRADFYDDSPLRLGSSHDRQARQMIDWLFDPEDTLWMGGIYDTGKATHRANFRTAKEWLTVPDLPPRISAGTYQDGGYHRNQESLARSPHLIIESDELIGRKATTAEDRAANQRLNAALMLFLADRFHLELRALIDTGGKSLHGWFKHPGKETKQALGKLLNGLAIDSAVFRNGSSYPLRAPGCLHEATGNRASLYYLNPTF